MAKVSPSIKKFIRPAISALMLALVFRLTDFNKLGHVFSGLSPLIIIGVVIGYTVGPLLNCYRWLLFARAGGVKATYPQAVRAFFIGAFVNAFGFGTVGGDVARGVMLAKGQDAKAAALAAVLADRLHGLAMLALIGSISALIFGAPHLDNRLLLVLGAIGPGVILAWFIGPWMVRKCFSSTSKFRNRVEEVANSFPKDPKILALVSLLSVFFHLTQIGLHMLMAYGLHVAIPLKILLVVVPFVNIAGSLPISWMGLGVREQSYKFFLAPEFLSTEQAVAFGAIWLLAVTVASSVGGLLSVLSPSAVPEPPTPVEL